jgi:hypothetical protein
MAGSYPKPIQSEFLEWGPGFGGFKSSPGDFNVQTGLRTTALLEILTRIYDLIE